MRYGICPLSIVPVYESPDANSALKSQLLYGELYKIPESRKVWSRIRCQLDRTEGWVRNDQLYFIKEDRYEDLITDKNARFASDLVAHACNEEGILIPVLMGSTVSHCGELSHQFEGAVFTRGNPRENLVNTALLYLNSPELSGGRSPFGIDASGLSQMVYKSIGQELKRLPEQQAMQGIPLSFIEESSPGDLAFFDGPDGNIHHVGIIMKDNYIIHVNGKVRIDRLDHTGIFNNDLRDYTHPLRVIKQIL